MNWKIVVTIQKILFFRYKKAKKDQQPINPVENDGTGSDEVENNVHCTPPKKKRLLKNSPKKEDQSRALLQNSYVNCQLAICSTKTPETPTPMKYKMAESRQELPKKRWLREATMEQFIDNYQLNQSRPTVLVRADSRPLSPPWTPTTVETPIYTSTPKGSVMECDYTSLSNLLTPPDTKYVSEDEQSNQLCQFQKMDEELAWPLPSEDEAINSCLPLNLSQNNLF